MVNIEREKKMLYRPEFLRIEYKKQSASAWQYYTDCLETSCNDRNIQIARDLYIQAHNKVAAISREIKKRDRTIKKPIQAEAGK